jgi:glycosyltransferase involved in cell wall biosynthesis
VLRIIHLGVLLDPQRSPSQMLVDWRALVDTTEMVAGAGGQVTVIQASRLAEVIHLHGVTYHFLVPDTGRTLCASGCFARLIGQLAPDVVHLNGLGFPREVIDLARLLPATPIFIQDHANGVPRIWRRRLRRKALAAAAGVSFCALSQAEPFVRARMFAERTQLFEIPECSSRFTPADREAARRVTGVVGDPAVLWVGHLNANKDPLTVLEGISQVLGQLPDLHLWCCFGNAPLRNSVEQRLVADARLRDRVHLLGQVPHETIEQLMRAADLFVAGSHREGSGFSVIEALACGLPPIVTSIPSFRSLTAQGKVGALWACDDAIALRAALLCVAGQPRAQARAAAREHFERELSFDAVGRKFLAAYEKLCVTNGAGAVRASGAALGLARDQALP